MSRLAVATKLALCTATAVDECHTLNGLDMDIDRTSGTLLVNDLTGEEATLRPKAKRACTT